MKRSVNRSGMVLVLANDGKAVMRLDGHTREGGWDEGVTSRQSEGDGR